MSPKNCNSMGNWLIFRNWKSFWVSQVSWKQTKNSDFIKQKMQHSSFIPRYHDFYGSLANICSDLAEPLFNWKMNVSKMPVLETRNSCLFLSFCKNIPQINIFISKTWFQLVLVEQLVDRERLLLLASLI